MSRPRTRFALPAVVAGSAVLTFGAQVVPPYFQLPGTQPQEAAVVDSAERCATCHGNYDQDAEPYHNWLGSMMSHSSRDPVFWAALAVAENTVEGSGDFCIRCHVSTGWMDGRSTPTNGELLEEGDADGVACDLCHTMVNPDGSEHGPVQSPPFEAHDGGAPPEAYRGSGMVVRYNGIEKLGPYDSTAAPHDFTQSRFHRSSDMCGTCHDVSNPATGDLAHNNGAPLPLAPGTFDGSVHGPVDGRAAFNNPPFAYGVVERTFSEHKASGWESVRVGDYPSLPADLQGGILEEVYDRSLAAGNGGDYEDGTPRYYTCQSCHMPPTEGRGCVFGTAPVRKDLPQHDLTGGNYWAPEAILYLNWTGNRVKLGGKLEAAELAGLEDGMERAKHTLEGAAGLSVSGDTLKVVNRTGHKLISGYNEGRRMWLNVKWYDGGGQLVREDGAYGLYPVHVRGHIFQVETIVDLADPHARIYESHMSMDQEWAQQLIGFGVPADLPLQFHRQLGSVVLTLGDLAASAPGTVARTFHFSLNNVVQSDNRIPPYGFRYDDALERNARPVPPDQYGDPGPGGVYRYWDEVALDPPDGAVTATIDLLYQPTSWEYVQFLYLAGGGDDPFLAAEGAKLMDAWLNTGMAAPHVMASTTWNSSARGAELSPVPPNRVAGAGGRPRRR